MGSYSEVKLGSLRLGSTKDGYDPYLLSLFQESDKRIVDSTLGECGLYGEVDQGEEDESITLVQYVCSGSVARDRLELMGFTRSVAEKGFRVGLKSEIEKLEEWSHSSLGDVFEETLDVLRHLTLEQWQDALREVEVRSLDGISTHDHDTLSTLSSLLRYVLTNEWYGFPGHELRHFLRLIIDTFPLETELVYDLTGLVLGGWITDSEELIQYLDDEVSANYNAERRIIVITEGHTDSVILSRSISLLYPHIAEFFRFLDFQGPKVPGGAGALAGRTRAFIGAGIVNRVISLFDNDTAAEAAIASLASVKLPGSIIVCQYPDLELASNYPTLGPSGMVSMDVNGLAGSIEMYLGTDCLLDESGNLYPVHWKGFDSNLRKYQGEVMQKRAIMKAFEQKLSACEANPELVDNYDWSGIKSIIDSLRSAFQAKDEELILNHVPHW